jgi:hypothetical protein
MSKSERIVDWMWLVVWSGVSAVIGIPLSYVVGLMMSMVAIMAFIWLPALGLIVGLFIG